MSMRGEKNQDSEQERTENTDTVHEKDLKLKLMSMTGLEIFIMSKRGKNLYYEHELRENQDNEH
jgi:hypothetical protein